MTSKAAADPSTISFAQNWVIYQLYVRQEYDECLAKIEAQLKLCNGLCEYAVFVKGAPALSFCSCCPHSVLTKRDLQ